MSIANYDAEAGIHYGFIYCNDVGGDAFCEIQDNGTDLGYEQGKDDVKKRLAAMVPEINEAIAEFENTLRSIVSSYSDWDEGDTISELELVPDPVTEEGVFDRGDFGQLIAETCEDGPYRYEQDGYLLDTTSDNGLFVIKSPYFTYCRVCSPCAPNAGYLKDQPGGLKTYCLGADWFDEYSPLPYTVYSVETGEVVTEGPKEEE